MNCPAKRNASQTGRRTPEECGKSKAGASRRLPGSFFVIERSALPAVFALHRSAVVLYLHLASRANGDGVCWPSIRSIVVDTGIPRRSAIRAIADLQAAGLIDVESGRGCRTTSTYRIVPPMAPLHTSNGATHGTGIVPPMAHNGATHGTSNGATHGTRNENHMNEIQERDSLNEKKNAANAAGASSTFDVFWISYPRKASKERARKAFLKAIKATSAETIIEAAKQFAASPKGQAGDYCPHPATWLNDRRWEDDRATWSNGTPVNGRRGAGAVYDPQASERNPAHGKF